ncbi:hypothetical protein ACP70R_045253 [Stipagrostis hirtigluma subsp. patula]
MAQGRSAKDTYNIMFGMLGGRENRYNSPGQGRPWQQGGIGYSSSNHINHPGQSQASQLQGIEHTYNFGQGEPPQQEVLLPAPEAFPSAPQLAVGDYHGDYHPQHYHGSFVPHQGGYGSHGGAHMGDMWLVGAATGLTAFGLYKILRERRPHGRRH